ncbi:GIY-YIG nuclease family protein [Neobacillus sp. NPDC093127]|uniref:GIY-YIG nuclease family protein n=1 Tax=Neobacillus sp. NPDC093127 TaxID=3364296 RepID=UPI0037FA2F02
MSKKFIVGVYKITNKINRKFYIGSSKDILLRWKDHINDYNRNNHHSRYLQNSWNKYGEEAFHFEIIHETDEQEELVPLEQAYLDMLTPWKRDIGYNVSKYADCALRGRKRLMSSRLKQSLGVRGVNNHFFGKTHDERVRAIISESNKGRFTGENSSTVKLTWDDIHNIRDLYKNKSAGEIHKMYPMIHLSGVKYIIRNKTWYDPEYEPPELSKEELKARRLANQKWKHTAVVMLDKDTGKIIRSFNSTKEAAQFHGRQKGSDISAVCRGKQVSAYGYKWMYKEEYEKISNPD